MTAHDHQNSLPSLAKSFFVLIFVLPFAGYSYFILRYMVNIPFDDDYDLIFNFMNNFLRANTTGERISLLFVQHNEHRVVFERLVVLAQYYLFGEINIGYLILAGNLGWICTVAVFILFLRRHYHLPLLHLLPIPYIMLSFTHWDIMFFATSALANYWAMLFFMLFMISVTHNRLTATGIFFIAAMCTLANGLILYFIGAAHWYEKRNWRNLLFFSILAAVLVLCYFDGYQKPMNHPSIHQAVLQPITVIEYVILFWGNMFRLKYLAIVLGGGMLASSAYFFMTRRNDGMLRLLILFTLLTSLAAAITRSGFGVEQALSSRYSIYSLFVCASLYVLILTYPQTRVDRKTIVLGSIVCALLFWSNFVVRYEHNLSFAIEREKRIFGFVRFVGGDDEGLNYYNHARAAEMLTTADSLKSYDVSAVLYRLGRHPLRH